MFFLRKDLKTLLREKDGISIREDEGFTKNTSTFVPHIFV